LNAHFKAKKTSGIIKIYQNLLSAAYNSRAIRLFAVYILGFDVQLFYMVTKSVFFCRKIEQLLMDKYTVAKTR
jgi:hypothetical protein